MAGYRHRVRIERTVRAQDPGTGYVTEAWVPFAEDVPANIDPIRARDRMAADQQHAAVDTKISIRWLPGVTAAMRIVNPHDDDRVYAIKGVLPDPTQRREIVLECESGVSQGQ